MRTEVKTLHFPSLGYSDAVTDVQAFVYMTPAACNAVYRKAGNGSFTGGVRPKLGGKYAVSAKSLSAIHSVRWMNADGTAETAVFGIADGRLVRADEGRTYASGGVAATETGKAIVTEDGREISLFEPRPLDKPCLCSGEGRIFFFSEGGVRSYAPASGVEEVVLADVGGADSLAYWHGRLVVYGGDNVLRFSAVFNPKDFDIGKSETLETKSTDMQLADAGFTGGRITAFIPVDDTNAYASTEDSLWKITGDATKGVVSCISRERGALSSRAFAKGDGGEIAFVAHDGVHFIRQDGSIIPLEGKVSGELWRRVDALSALDARAAQWIAAYDPQLGGYCVFNVPHDGSQGVFFLIDETRAVWPFSFRDGYAPVASCRHGNETLYACRDATIRAFSPDGDEEFPSAVAIGPVVHSKTFSEDSMLTELHVALREMSGDIGVSVVSGRTVDETVEKAKAVAAHRLSVEGDVRHENEAYEFKAHKGFNPVFRPRMRGNAFAVVLWSAGGEWEFHGVSSRSRALGRIRM